VLKLRDALLNNYDPLVATLNLVNAHKRDLQDSEHGIVRVGGAELGTAMAGVAAKLAEKDALLEQFKSENALLKNSFHYFPLRSKGCCAIRRSSGGPQRHCRFCCATFWCCDSVRRRRTTS